MPRWVSRLGSYKGVGHGDLAPSPLLGSPATPPPPIGGQPLRWRSPTRTQRPLPPPTPPSCSDIPAEAIQAEVQRHLEGLLSRLQVADEQNQVLRQELDLAQRTLVDARRSTEASRERSMAPAATSVCNGVLLLSYR